MEMFQSISSIDFVYFLSQADQVDSKFLWLKVIAFLCILGALGFFISRFNKNKIINSQIKGDGRIRIADSCSLGNRQYLVIAQCDKDRFLLGEETGGNDAPSAAETVDGRGIERVVDFQLLEKSARAVIDESTDQTDECGGPRFDHDTIAGNRNETGEDPITHRTDIQRLCQEVVDGKRRDAASRGA